jgi:hypothetical protein
MSTRFIIAALIYMVVNSILFGFGVTIVLTIPTLSANANMLVLVVVIFAMFLAFPLSWILAPRLQARYWQRRRADAALKNSV